MTAPRLAPRPAPVEFVLEGLKLESANVVLRMHRGEKMSYVKNHVTRAKAACDVRVRAPMTWPLLVTITRIRPKGKQRLDRWDNLPSSAKYVIDGICASLGIDDGDERFQAGFLQAVGDDWGVRIRVESLGNEPIVRLPPKLPRQPRAKPKAETAKTPKPPRVGRGGKGKGVQVSQLPLHLQAHARAELRRMTGRAGG